MHIDICLYTFPDLDGILSCGLVRIKKKAHAMHFTLAWNRGRADIQGSNIVMREALKANSVWRLELGTLYRVFI